MDFHEVPPTHQAMHERLLNWARWVHGSAGSKCAPMFANYRSTEVWADRVASAPLDTLDAHNLEKAVGRLPIKHRESVRWHYVRSSNPSGCARKLGLTLAGLAQMVHDGRQMLINRRA